MQLQRRRVKSYRDFNNPKYTVSSKLGTAGQQAARRMISKARYISYETEQEAVLEVVNDNVEIVLPMKID